MLARLQGYGEDATAPARINPTPPPLDPAAILGTTAARMANNSGVSKTP